MYTRSSQVIFFQSYKTERIVIWWGKSEIRDTNTKIDFLSSLLLIYYSMYLFCSSIDKYWSRLYIQTTKLWFLKSNLKKTCIHLTVVQAVKHYIRSTYQFHRASLYILAHRCIHIHWQDLNKYHKHRANWNTHRCL